ncbi:hypothetical protein EW026_g3031 [Hermanssonia centrifuga]|uniref:Uncharacterized protein n=1 Tax=Hermanssonia centrifuga TaxID=98765 RepID=A0A4S4KLD9_9APHY|nr:hypothetical protein EW026_g3031 [Hermanssonia centrifuga]
MGSTTLFCGRILTFLSQVFPLGERSGVNLRGEYGPIWDGPGGKNEEGQDIKAEEAEEKPKEPVADEMQVDEPSTEGTKPPSTEHKQEHTDDFYQTFWSLQLPFSKPSLFAEQATFSSFKESVNKALPVIKEATAKERAMMGKANASSAASLKRKREPENFASKGQEYFFAKYLTSPELLDLEIDFTLDATDAQWVQETIQKVSEELRQTTPSGRTFAETVHVILEREKNWIRWKNELCAPFDKEPWAEEIEEGEDDGRRVKRKIGLEEATREVRRKLTQEDREDWPHALGSAPLTEIWTMGYRDLADLQHPFQPGDVPDFVKKVKQEDAKIDARKKQLAKTAGRIAQTRAKAAAASAAASPAPAPAPVPAPVIVTPAQDAATLTTPRPTLATASAPVATPPLHPSLPAKPGTTPARPPPPPPQEPKEPIPPPIIAPTPTPAVIPPVVVETVLPPDDVITKHEENKQRWSWLALRTARDQYLQHFGKIGTGDVLLLAQEIEKEKIERETALREEAANPGGGEGGTNSMQGSQESGNGTGDIKGEVISMGDIQAASFDPESRTSNVRDSEGDIKMGA